jgi:hypothetical protein
MNPITDIHIFLKYRVSMVFILLFILSFLPLRYKKTKTILIAIGCFVLTGLVDYIHLSTTKTLTIGMRYSFSILLIILTQGTALLLCRYRDWRAIFTGVTASAYVLAGDMLWNITANATGSFPLAFAVQIAVHMLLLTLAIKYMREISLRETERTDDNWVLLSTGPILFYMLTYTVVYHDENSYGNLQINTRGAIYLILLMIIAFISMVQSFERKREEIELSHENLMLKNYASALKHESETIRVKDDTTAIIRHDMRHMNIMMVSYLESGDLEKAKELIHELDVKLDSTVARHYCTNVAINGVLAGSAGRAKELNVQFECNAEVPENLPHTNEFEFASVVANLAENAINAAANPAIPEEKRIVRFRIALIKETQLSVKVTNPYAGVLTYNKRTGLPESHGGEGHGYGLRSVQLYAERNNGVFKYCAQGNQFVAEVLVKY